MDGFLDCINERKQGEKKEPPAIPGKEIAGEALSADIVIPKNEAYSRMGARALSAGRGANGSGANGVGGSANGEDDQILSELMAKVRDLEGKVKTLEAGASKYKSGAGSSSAPGGPGGDEGGEGGEGGEEPKQDIKEMCVSPCTNFWGGPTQTRSNDSFFSFFERFFGGVTTAHGINRVFDDDIGIVRRIFWLGFFIAGCYGAYFFIGSVIDDYIGMGVSTAVSEGSHSGNLPMVSVCNVSPYQCLCEAFYDPVVLQDQNFEKVIPYLCKEVLVYKDSPPDDLDQKTGNPPTRGVLEDNLKFVDKIKTKAKIEAFRPSLLSCDKDGGFTKAWMVNQIDKNQATLTDLFIYAGLAATPKFRSQTVKDCTVIDNKAGSLTFGKKISCNDDSWWGATYIHDRYGVCNVFNPCHDIPVGNDCEDNGDCEHPLNLNSIEGSAFPLPDYAKVEGGQCVSKKCVCNSCLKGKDCNVALQGKAGKGLGARLVLNSAPIVDTPIMSAQQSQWSPGNWLHFHTNFDKGLLQNGISVGPGQVYDISLARDKYVEFRGYPYSNCSAVFNLDPDLCRENCLQRLQTIECCNVKDADIPKVKKGKWMKPLNYTQPDLKLMDAKQLSMENPFIVYPSCNVFDQKIMACKLKLQTKFNNGEICLDGALGASKPYPFLFINGLGNKPNSYSDGGQDKDGITDQEREFSAIDKHCMWSETQLADGMPGMYGKQCKTDKDCKSDVGGDDGLCVEASRAFCPNRCNRYNYRVKEAGSAAMSAATVQILAARELATVTEQVKIIAKNAVPALDGNALATYVNITGVDSDQQFTLANNAATKDIRTRKFKPKCHPGLGISDTMTEVEQKAVMLKNTSLDVVNQCFNVWQAETFVKVNYVVVNIDFQDFVENEYSQDEAVSLATVIGTVGGNLGLFMGFSIMTIIEWFEMFFFFVMGIPVFLTAGKLNIFWMFVRKEDDDGDGGDEEKEDEDKQ